MLYEIKKTLAGNRSIIYFLKWVEMMKLLIQENMQATPVHAQFLHQPFNAIFLNVVSFKFELV